MGNGPEGFHLLTFHTYRKRNVFIDETVNRVLCDAMNFHIEQGHVAVGGYVIMPDHIHILIRPLTMTCPEFVNNFKAYTGIKVKAAGKFSRKVWRRRFYEQPVDDPVKFRRVLENIHGNPVIERPADGPEEYAWSSCSDYAGRPGIVAVTVVRLE